MNTEDKRTRIREALGRLDAAGVNNAWWFFQADRRGVKGGDPNVSNRC